MQIYDVIVIGAGPSGSTAARIAAKNGLEVLLLDQKAFPREKVCGGYLSCKTLRLLAEPLPDKVVEQYIYGVRLYDRHYRFIQKKEPGLLGVTVRRDQFDQHLVQEAVRAGAQFINPLKVRCVQPVEGFQKVHVYTADGMLAAKKVIVAEGANGVIAQKAGLQKKWRKWQWGFTLTTVIKGGQRAAEQAVPYVELYCIPFLGGFGWAFPLRDGYNIGVGSWACQAHALYRYVTPFLAQVCRLKNIGQEAPRFQGSYMPAGGFPRKLGSRSVLLTGDCGGFVDPFSGEGIYYGIRSGEIAASEVVKSMVKGDYDAGANYRKRCKQAFYYDFYCSLAKALRSGTKRAICAGTPKADRFLADIMHIMKNPKAYRMHNSS